MAVDPAALRRDFPEFADCNVYPDSAITFWLSIASTMLNGPLWSTLLDLGLELFAAHNLVLEAKAQKEARFGAPPGVTTGAVASKSVDKVAVAYDTAAGIEPDAGHWNLTIYGIRLILTVRMIGAGGIQL